MISSFKIRGSLRTRVMAAFLAAFIPLFVLLIVSVEGLLVPSVKSQAIKELNNTTLLLRNAVQASATASIRNHLKTIADKNREVATHHFDLVQNGVLEIQEAKRRLRDIFLSQQVGTSGYIYCIDSEGIAVIHPREGVEGTDNTGFPFIHDQIKMKEGYIEYDWRNPEDEFERPKALYMSYFEPFDWIISASSYRSEFSELLNPSDFRDAVLSLHFGKRGYAYVFAIDGQVLIHPTLADINVLENEELPTEFVRQMVSMRSGSIEYSWQNPDETEPNRKIAVFETLAELEWIVVSSAYLEDVLEPVRLARYLGYGSILLMLIISFFVAALLSKRLSRPVEVMANTLDKNSRLGLHEPLPIEAEAEDELGRLANEFNKYLSVVEEQNQTIHLERARYLNLFETSPDAIFLLDNLRIVDCNQSTCKLFDSSVESMLGKSIFDLSPPKQPNGESSEEMAKSIVDSLNKSDVKTFEWIHINTKGKPFNAEVRLKPFEHPSDKPLLVAFVRDITERKQWEEKLFKQSSFIETLLRAIPLPVFYKDKNGVYLGCNKAFTEVMGVAHEEILGNTVQQLWPSELAEKYHLMDLQLIKNPQHQVYEFKVKNKKGELLDVIFAKDIFYDEKGKPAGLVGAFIDITEQKRTASQLEKYKNHLELLVKERTEDLEAANQELVSINEELINQRSELETTLEKLQSAQNQLVQSEKMASLGVLAAGVAHEINNPLNFILGGAWGLEKYFNKNLKDHLPNVSKLINAINEGVRRATNIVASLNHFSRKDEVPSSLCDISSIIDHCLVMLNNDMKYRIEVVKEFTNETYSLLGFEGKLHQVFLNLLVNSVQAIPENGTITIKSQVESDNLVVTINDTGIGISKEDLNKIVDPFFTTKEPGKGTGLGLSITNSIIEEHGGTLIIDSQLGVGTTVTVKLPINTNKNEL